METFNTILMIIALLDFFVFVHYSGYLWARGNASKMYIEFFFDVEKKPNSEQNVQECDATKADSSTKV